MKPTQCDLILRHMKSGSTITPLEALNLYGCMRLAARINDLKQQGYEIRSDVYERNGKRFAGYSMRRA